MEGIELRLKYLENELEYIEHMIPSYQKKFTERLKVLNRTKLKPEYDNLNTIQRESTSNVKPDDPELKKLYHKLMLRYHPDKSTESNSDKISVFINNCYEKGNIEPLQIIDESGEYSEDIPVKLLKIHELENKIEKYKNSLFWAWNTSSIKQYIESYFCSEDEYDKLKSDLINDLEKENERLKKENKNLSHLCEIANKSKEEIENNKKIAYREMIEKLYENCIKKRDEMIIMKEKANSNIPYNNYENELNQIKNLNYNELLLPDLEKYEPLLNIIKRYFDEQYWIYRKIWFAN